MRIVSFPFVDRFAPWPDDRNQFENTRLVNGAWVGKYYGSDATIPTYTGEWPVVDITYKTEMTPGEYQLLFTADEFDVINTARSIDKLLNQLWAVMITSPVISMSSSTVQSGMTHMVTELYITQSRADVIMKGIPE